MADPVTAAVVLTAVSAAGSIGQGMAAKQAAELEAEQYREEQENARVAALQDEAQRRRELERVLGRQAAVRAGRGLSMTSGSARRLRDVTVENAERDILTSQVNFLNRQSRFGLAADQASARGTSALVGGFTRAAGSGGSTAMALS